MTTYQPVAYKYTSTKEYIDAFPIAYRQWRADTHCQKIHGYALSIKLYFGANDLDVRNWVQDYSGLSELLSFLKTQMDHTFLAAEDDPELEIFKELDRRGIAKLIILPNLGCEAIADQLYKYINGVYIPDMLGKGESERIWCYRVEVRETQSNMAFREGFREWNESLLD
jgi:6-pyruvoyltetrahydropterin/6-carboxytetrahydropterin synthase